MAAALAGLPCVSTSKNAGAPLSTANNACAWAAAAASWAASAGGCTSSAWGSASDESSESLESSLSSLESPSELLDLRRRELRRRRCESGWEAGACWDSRAGWLAVDRGVSATASGELLCGEAGTPKSTGHVYALAFGLIKVP